MLTEISETIAERVRILGVITIGSFTDFLANTQLEEQPTNVPDVFDHLAGHETIVRYLREAFRK